MTKEHKKLVEILNKFGNDFDIMQESEAISLCADGILMACKLSAIIKELKAENKKVKEQKVVYITREYRNNY